MFEFKPFRFTESDYVALKSIYENNTAAQSLIAGYEEDDIAAVSLFANSTSLWLISPPSLHRFKNDLLDGAPVKIRYTISISRLTHDQSSDIVETNQAFHLAGNDSVRQDLLEILNEENSEKYIRLPNLFPKFLKVSDQH